MASTQKVGWGWSRRFGRVRSGFGFHSKCDEGHEWFSSRGATASHSDVHRLVLVVVPGKTVGDIQAEAGKAVRRPCSHLGERCWQLRPED